MEQKLRRYIENLIDWETKYSIEGEARINLYGIIQSLESLLNAPETENKEFAVIALKFPSPRIQQMRPASSFTRDLKMEVEGKPLMVRSYSLAGEEKAAELTLIIPPSGFTIETEGENK